MGKILREHSNILRPTFVLISPGAAFNVATVHACILEPYDPTINYFNYTFVKVPKEGFCHQRDHGCPNLLNSFGLITSELYMYV